MATTTGSMTVEQFRQLPETGPFYYELRHGAEVAIRALPEFELRVAEVACLSAERWQRVDLGDNIRGAPDLVLEVLSPSNAAAEINAKEKRCLEKISAPEGITTASRLGQAIPLAVLGGGALTIDDIMA